MVCLTCCIFIIFSLCWGRFFVLVVWLYLIFRRGWNHHPENYHRKNPRDGYGNLLGAPWNQECGSLRVILPNVLKKAGITGSFIIFGGSWNRIRYSSTQCFLNVNLMLYLLLYQIFPTISMIICWNVSYHNFPRVFCSWRMAASWQCPANAELAHRGPCWMLSQRVGASGQHQLWTKVAGRWFINADSKWLIAWLLSGIVVKKMVTIAMIINGVS